MFVGSVYWFLSLANGWSDCRVTIWDLNSERVVFDSEEHEWFHDLAFVVDECGFGDYEISSFDVYRDRETGKERVEINIEVEEDEEE